MQAILLVILGRNLGPTDENDLDVTVGQPRLDGREIRFALLVADPQPRIVVLSAS